MAGALPAAGADRMFASGIRLAQRIGIPEALEDRPVFHMPDPLAAGGAYADEDEQDVPWDLHATPIDPVPERGADVVAGVEEDQVLVSVVEKGSGVEAGQATAFGDFDPDRHALLFLLPEWEKVAGFETVTISGNTYDRGKELPRRGLGLNTIIRVVVHARDAASPTPEAP